MPVSTTHRIAIVVALLSIAGADLFAPAAMAYVARASASTSVTRSAGGGYASGSVSRTATGPGGNSVSRTASGSVNRAGYGNVNVNRTAEVNVRGGYGYGGYGCCYHPVATAAAVTATAAVTAAAVGSIVGSLPPSCTTTIINGFSYRQCGNTWYQPQIGGSSTTYVVVNAPR